MKDATSDRVTNFVTILVELFRPLRKKKRPTTNLLAFQAVYCWLLEVLTSYHANFFLFSTSRERMDPFPTHEYWQAQSSGGSPSQLQPKHSDSKVCSQERECVYSLTHFLTFLQLEFVLHGKIFEPLFAASTNFYSSRRRNLASLKWWAAICEFVKDKLVASCKLC